MPPQDVYPADHSHAHMSGLCCAGDLKGANVLLKSSGDDPRGYTCKVRVLGSVVKVLNSYACSESELAPNRICDASVRACNARTDGCSSAQLADFGLSRVLEAHATHVSTKTYGTLAYMPGEESQHSHLQPCIPDPLSFTFS